MVCEPPTMTGIKPEGHRCKKQEICQMADKRLHQHRRGWARCVGGDKKRKKKHLQNAQDDTAFWILLSQNTTANQVRFWTSENDRIGAELQRPEGPRPDQSGVLDHRRRLWSAVTLIYTSGLSQRRIPAVCRAQLPKEEFKAARQSGVISIRMDIQNTNKLLSQYWLYHY